jgi:hypothetical protein
MGRNTKYFYLATEVFFRSLLQLLVTGNVIPSSSILVILMMEVVRFPPPPETSVLTRTTPSNIPEDGVLKNCITSLGLNL